MIPLRWRSAREDLPRAIHSRHACLNIDLPTSPFHYRLLPLSILSSSPFHSSFLPLPILPRPSGQQGWRQATDSSRLRWRAKGRVAHGEGMDLHQELQSRQSTWPPHRQQHLLRCQAIHRRRHHLLHSEEAPCKVLRHILAGGRNLVLGFMGVQHLQIHGNFCSISDLLLKRLITIVRIVSSESQWGK